METKVKRIDGLEPRPLVLNIGPSHPAMHNTLRLIAELDGEILRKGELEIGYLHCGFEKIAESKTYHQFIVYTDRMGYTSALANNIGYVLAVEKLLGIDVPERCMWIRMILAELARISDHAMSVGLAAMDIGAFTVMLYGFIEREICYDIFEATTGGRMTMSYPRIGGLARDVPADFRERALKIADRIEPFCQEVEQLLDGNRIWNERTRGVGVIPREDAVSYGITGPILRSFGVDYDIRKVNPYLFYDRVEFDVPLAEDGDVFDRYKVRVNEMRQAARIIRQCCEKMPAEGPVNVDDHGIILPPKDAVYESLEALIHHFKLVMHGIRIPAGESYFATETPNGELGFYIVSDGSRHPVRMRVRPPTFYNCQPYVQMSTGGYLADAIAIMASLNIAAGELDR
jgi:NADH dehydrogenase I D subunit